jgi:hypothetical protein
MFKRRKREHDPDTYDAGACRTCGKTHSHRCAIPGCDRTGTMSDSTTHECSGNARWVSAVHYRDRAA